ncbi:hypothetical protein ACHQM5_007258 [Ranunculus cassubicifolius]
MTRRCSHCSNNGHNSRTCPNRGVKLFGVRLTDGSIRKSASMGNLSHYTGSNALHISNNHLDSPGDTPEHGDAAEANGYASEDFVKGSSSSCRERKKGTPWTEEEHRMFLLGLQKLGKGDWRGIARNYVISRTPTQVASHAQKYFIRQTNMSRRKRRSSLFDIIADEQPVDTTQVLSSQDLFPMTHLQQEVEPPAIDEECESMDSTNSNDGETTVPVPSLIPETCQSSYPVIFPAYFSPFFPFSLPLWPGYTTDTPTQEAHEVVKPTAVHSKCPINVDELVGMSKLSLNSEPSSLSLKLMEGNNRQSAFQAKPSTNDGSSKSPIHAV